MNKNRPRRPIPGLRLGLLVLALTLSSLTFARSGEHSRGDPPRQDVDALAREEALRELGRIRLVESLVRAERSAILIGELLEVSRSGKGKPR